MEERDNEALKSDVRQFWERHPCGTQFTSLEAGSREFFDHVEQFRHWSQPFMEEVYQFTSFKGTSILEIGCGLGTDLLRFARAGAVVTGVDLTTASVSLVAKRFEQEQLPVRLSVADAERLPFDDETFDAVYSFGVLHHTPNTLKAVQEAQRVLKPGGKFLLMLYHRRSIHVWLGLLMNAVVRRYSVRNGSVDEWIRIFDGAGNPLGKAYTRSEVRGMLTAIDDIRFTVCDPVRRNYPGWINGLNQRLLARWFGFYLVMIGTKREGTAR